MFIEPGFLSHFSSTITLDFRLLAASKLSEWSARDSLAAWAGSRLEEFSG
jgi:hypothetical protein